MLTFVGDLNKDFSLQGIILVHANPRRVPHFSNKLPSGTKVFSKSSGCCGLLFIDIFSFLWEYQCGGMGIGYGVWPKSGWIQLMSGLQKP